MKEFNKEEVKKKMEELDKLKKKVATLPLHQEGMKVRCPLHNLDGTPIDDDDVKGCGSDDLIWTEEEALYDCRNCGIFFAPYAAEPPHQRGKMF